MKTNSPQYDLPGQEHAFNLAGEVIKQQPIKPAAVADQTPDLFNQHEPIPLEICGVKPFGFMPACVLPKGHDGEHQDGFGGHYGKQ